jgi:hypothetical protein
MRIPHLFVFCLLCLVESWSSSLRAQATGSTAEELFRQGRAAAEAGDFARACDRFAASEKLEPAPGTLLNIADCEQHLGKLVLAEEHFELAASGFSRTDPRRAFVVRRVAEIEQRLAHVTVHASILPEGAQVTRDGAPFDLRTLDQPLKADPRTTTFVVSAPGLVDRAFVVALRDGQSAEVTLGPGESAPAAASLAPIAPAESPSPRAARATWRTLGYVAGVTGVASIAVGAVTGALALHEASVVKGHCQIPAYTCDAQGVSAGATGQSYALASTVTLAVGAALVVTGVLLVLVNRAPKSEQSALAVLPYAGPSGGGALAILGF